MSVDIIILNAGLSKRMQRYSKGMPKALLDLFQGYCILDYQLLAIENYFDAIKNIFLVVGYRKELFYEHVKKYKLKIREKIRFVVNERYAETDNAYSVFLAIKEDPNIENLIILDGDILFHPNLFKKLVESRYENVLLVDFNTKITEEDNKALVIGNFVRKLGKQIEGNGIYCSMIRLSGEFLNLFKEELQNTRWWKTWYSTPLNYLIGRHPTTVYALSTEGLPRMDIDTPEEFLEASTFVQKHFKQPRDLLLNL